MEQGMCKRCNKIYKRTSKKSKICMWCNMNKYPKRPKNIRVKMKYYRCVVDDRSRFIGLISADNLIEMSLKAKAQNLRLYGQAFKGTE